MASHKPTIQVHFSFGEHVSKGHAKNALRQLEGMGPFDLYSPEVAILQGQRDILSRNLTIKNQLILRAKPSASKAKVPNEFFNAIGESYDFGGFAKNEFELCLQKGLPYVPLSVHEVPLAQKDNFSIEGRVHEDISWEQEYVINLRTNLNGGIDAMRGIWPFLMAQDPVRIFARFGTEHAPLFVLGEKAYSGDKSVRFTCSFDSKADEKAFRKMIDAGFDHGNVESRMSWMKSLADKSTLPMLVDDLKQISRMVLDVFSKSWNPEK